MSNLHQQACPLCANLAKYQLVRREGEPRKFFSCDVCAEYVISDAAEQWLRSQPRKCEDLSNLSSFLFGDLVLNIFMESDGETRALLAVPDGRDNWLKA